MKRLQAWKYELRPNGLQKRLMRLFCGCCRVVSNKALVLQEEQRKHREKKADYAELCKLLTAWRHAPETLWLAEVPVHPLQQVLKDLERVWTNCFAKRADAPRFKKRGHGDSFRYPNAKQIHLDEPNSRIFLPKLGGFRYRKSREIQSTIKSNGIDSRADPRTFTASLKSLPGGIGKHLRGPVFRQGSYFSCEAVKSPWMRRRGGSRTTPTDKIPKFNTIPYVDDIARRGCFFPYILAGVSAPNIR